MANPKATVEVTASSRTLGAKLREVRGKFVSFAKDLRGNALGKDMAEKGFFSKAGASMVGNVAADATRALGGFLVDQGKEVFDFEDKLVRLGITSNKSSEYMQNFGKSVRETSSEVGLSATDVLTAAQSYVALTGDMDGASASARTWARVAQATGSTVQDISDTAAALKQNLGIKPEEMEAAFSSLAIQGKKGAIELKDLAGQMSSIAPQWAEFGGGKGVQGVRELGAALQITKRGFGGDAGETVTGLNSLLTSLIKNAGRFGAVGVKVRDKDGGMRNVLDIVEDIGNSKLAKNPTLLTKALGRTEAYRAYLQLHANNKELRDLVDQSTDASVINRDLATYSESAAGKTKIAWQQAKNEIAAAFTPERIQIFVDFILKAVSALAKIVSGISAVINGVKAIGETAGAGVVAAGRNKTVINTMNAVAPGVGDAFHRLTTSEEQDAAARGVARVRAEEAQRYGDTRKLVMASGVTDPAQIESETRARIAQQDQATREARAIAEKKAEADRAGGEVKIRGYIGEAARAIADAVASNTGVNVRVGAEPVVRAGRDGGTAHQTRPGK